MDHAIQQRLLARHARHSRHRRADALESSVKLSISSEGEAKAWKDVWSAGQGVGDIRDVPPAAELCRRLIAEYREAVGRGPE
jgi:NAD(P)H-dependent flavin oxidoreductase YrpB (nitropropane dioxygenase family)